MLKLWKAASGHEDLFIERYEQLLGWSLKLTAYDRQLAQDLLHDVFVQFTLRRPDLNAIQDLDGYLFAMLRNSHVSYVRRVPFVRTTPLSMAEYDSLEIGLRATDVRDQIKVQDELRMICQYAALRKETSKTGSVLILRFFHGYYPSEIAQILRSKIDTVRKWLQLARNEAKLYLENPDALSFIRETSQKIKSQGGFARTSEELLGDLREIIYASRSGDCFSPKQLRELYQSKVSETVDVQNLAHIVSCASDLDEVNALLDLPLLNDRYPTDMTGNDRGSGGPSSGPPPSLMGGGGSGKGVIKHSLRRVKETFEHYPRELRIAVNGYVQVSQRISSDLMEQTLSLDLEERIGFVEIFSEQWVRLFFLDVAPPPDGAFEQEARIDLSEGRSLRASLDFTGPCPNLRVVYHDPTLTAAESGVIPENEAKTDQLQHPTSNVQSPSGEYLRLPRRLRDIRTALSQRARDIRRAPLNLGILLRPAVVTTVLALVLTAVALFVSRGPSVSPSASTLLAQSVKAEEAIAVRTDQVIHRTINLEEKNSRDGTISRRRIEVWQSAERGITARRIYDEQNRLMAGDWRRADGVETLYAHGVKPQIQPVPGKRASVLLNFNNAWQQDLTARDFSALVRNDQALQINESERTYVLTYLASSADGLQRATLVLSRTDLHAMEQTLIVRQGSEERSYHYVETSFERRPPSAVAPAIFDPDPVLLSEGAKQDAVSMKGDANVSFPLPLSPTPAASAALEMEVVRLLDQAGAFGGDQVSVTRTPEGALSVEGVLDTEERKKELLSVLAPLSRHPALKMRLETQKDAMARQAAQKSGSASAGIKLDQVQVETSPPPAYTDLRNYFVARGLTTDASEREINAYVDSVLGRSTRARRHARALRQLAGRFSQEELRMLDDESRAKWRAMIVQHARSFHDEAEDLRRKLEPVFGPSANGATATEVTNDAELLKRIESLFALWTTVDESVRESFSLSSSGEVATPVKSARFWHSLRTAEALGATISAVRGR